MTTIITKYECKERLTGSPEIDIEAKADDEYGDILMSIVIKYPDGHQSNVAITVDYNKAYVATDLKVDRCHGDPEEDYQCRGCVHKEE